MKKKWWKEAVVYEIYPRSFKDSNGDGIGDIPGITSKLDYLRNLGVNVLWLTPSYPSPNDDNGYDVSDYKDINPEFGTMEDFENLLREAHSRGIRILMDLVANHSSDEHAWFLESRSSRESDKRDYYIWRDPVDGHEPTNWGSCFGGSAWEWDEKTQQYYLHCFSKKQPDLNWDNPAVRREIYDIMRFWLDKGVDGFRMDVIAMISKPEVFEDTPSKDGIYGDVGLACCNGPRLHEYLQEMYREVLSHYDVMTVGEAGGTTPKEALFFAGEDRQELNMIFQFEHVNMDDDPIKGKFNLEPMDLPRLKKNLAKWQNELDGKAWNTIYFNNHDQPRAVSRLGDDSPASAKAIALGLYLMQGTPYLYQGEELGMTNYPFRGIEDYDDIGSKGSYRDLVASGKREPEELLRCIAYKSRDNARTMMQWDASANAGFTAGTPWFKVNPNYPEINAARQIGDPDSVYNFYKALISLRRGSIYRDLLVYGSYELLLPEDRAVYAYVRRYENQAALVISNLSGESVRPDLSAEAFRQFYDTEAALSTAGISIFREDTVLGPWEASVYIRTESSG